MSTATEEAIRFFKEKKGYSRLFQLFSEKIESLGNVGGSITLQKLTEEEKKVLLNWFQKDYSTKKSATISLKKFEQQFVGTKFEGAQLFDVVEGVIGRSLVYKKQEKEELDQKKLNYFNELNRKYLNSYTTILTEYINNKSTAVSGYIASYNKDDKENLELIYKALSLLPLEKPIRLPLFSEMVSGNPHEFDKDSKLITALQLIRERESGIAFQNAPNAELVSQILFEFGIVKDDLTNYVSLYGFLGERKGELLQSWRYSFLEGSIRNEPLREVVKLDRLYPIDGNVVFVVENSGVFSSIVDELGHLPLAIICTHGQFKLAALQVIKLLSKEKKVIYYAGDFDPEGLLMAYSLKQKHPNNIRYWRYTEEDYKSILSDIEIPMQRLKKLDNISDDYLEPLMISMKENKKAAYQEKYIKNLINDIKQILSL